VDRQHVGRFGDRQIGSLTRMVIGSAQRPTHREDSPEPVLLRQRLYETPVFDSQKIGTQRSQRRSAHRHEAPSAVCEPCPRPLQLGAPRPRPGIEIHRRNGRKSSSRAAVGEQHLARHASRRSRDASVGIPRTQRSARSRQRRPVGVDASIRKRLSAAFVPSRLDRQRRIESGVVFLEESEGRLGRQGPRGRPTRSRGSDRSSHRSRGTIETGRSPFRNSAQIGVGLAQARPCAVHCYSRSGMSAARLG